MRGMWLEVLLFGTILLLLWDYVLWVPIVESWIK